MISFGFDYISIFEKARKTKKKKKTREKPGFSCDIFLVAHIGLRRRVLKHTTLEL